MIDLPDNWDQLESEYYKHHDPYDQFFCEICDAIKEDFCICEEKEE